MLRLLTLLALIKAAEAGITLEFGTKKKPPPQKAKAVEKKEEEKPPPQAPPPPPFVSRGWLMKKGRKRRNWKRRYFVLSDDWSSISYYEDERCLKERLLRLAVWRGEARALAVLPHAAPGGDEGRLRLGVRQQCEGTAGLATRKAISAGVKSVAAPPRRRHASRRKACPQRRQKHQAHASNNSARALAELGSTQCRVTSRKQVRKLSSATRLALAQDLAKLHHIFRWTFDSMPDDEEAAEISRSENARRGFPPPSPPPPPPALSPQDEL